MGERENYAIGLPPGVSPDKMGSKGFAAYWSRYVRSRDGWTSADMHGWAIDTFQELKLAELRAQRAALTEDQIHPKRGRPPKSDQQT